MNTRRKIKTLTAIIFSILFVVFLMFKLVNNLQQTSDTSTLNAKNEVVSDSKETDEFSNSKSIDKKSVSENKSNQQVKLNEKQEESNENDSDKSIEISNKKYKDGIFKGEGYGIYPGIEVGVTIKDDEIINIEVISHNETIHEFERYKDIFSNITNTMIEKQSAEIDIVSGATFTSEGMTEAVENALKKALN